jgi:WD40 repeat protein
MVKKTFFQASKATCIDWCVGGDIVKDSALLATGDANRVRLWRYSDKGESDASLQCLSSIPSPRGSITALKSIDSSLVVAVTDSCDIALFDFRNTATSNASSSSSELKCVWHSSLTDSSISAARDVDIANDAAVVCTDDGRLCLIDIGNGGQLKSTLARCAEPLHSVRFASSTSVACAGRRLATCDLRASDASASSLLRFGDLSAPSETLCSVGVHLDQPNFLLSGSLLHGTLSLWDQRKPTAPLAAEQRAGGPLWRVDFHPRSTRYVLSCANDGHLTGWDRRAAPLNVDGGGASLTPVAELLTPDDLNRLPLRSFAYEHASLDAIAAIADNMAITIIGNASSDIFDP